MELAKIDRDVQRGLQNFVKEFNKREWSVRIAKTYPTFDDYARTGYIHQKEFGYGFVVNGRAVPYFHPNRSFHDEVIWLNKNLYYNPAVSFEDKIMNSAVVKFYGPSRTLNIITGVGKNLPPGLTDTGSPYVNFSRWQSDDGYRAALIGNIDLAFDIGQQIWGTTELRTSLQTASRNHMRRITGDSKLPFRPSHMLIWLASLANDMAAFYAKKPTMKESFEYLTEHDGIGNYYGYHFSSNLARMPGVGAGELIEEEFATEFKELQNYHAGLTHGKLDEDSDYVIAGPGSSATLKKLWPGESINIKNAMRLFKLIRDNQEEFFDIKTDEELRYLREATELGQFTTFGCEIACCQYNVFTRLATSAEMANARASAPISKEAGEADDSSLESLFG